MRAADRQPAGPLEQIGADVDWGRADLEACGQMVLANPDFVAREKTNSPMNDADPTTYIGGARRAVSTTRC